jgi:hypothetical protein
MLTDDIGTQPFLGPPLSKIQDLGPQTLASDNA